MTIGSSFLDDVWDVHCNCGFDVQNLTSLEAAHDTVRIHREDVRG